MRISDDTKAEILGLEQKLLDPSVREAPEWAGEFLSTDFIEIGQSGKSYDKKQILESMSARPLGVRLRIDDFEARLLAAQVILVTYRCGDAKRCSIWRLESGRWRMVFHQGTPCAD